MYINPFLAGVITCILVEVAIIVIAAAVTTIRKNKGRKS